MQIDELIQAISVKDVDVGRFVQMAIHEENTRSAIVHLLTTHPHILVYYHCYYVVSQASQERPELFYPYWDGIAPLLQHKNSYHRDIALTLLANLTHVDREDRFAAIYHDYFEHLHDERFMTAQCCIQNSRKIVRHKPGLRERIIALLLDIDRQCAYPPRQKALLKADILDILDEFYAETANRQALAEFIQEAAHSISPKTKRKARALAGKYGLTLTPA